MVELIRNKWCEDLEEILRCPGCGKQPKNLIYQCYEGHHMCSICRGRSGACPTCHNGFSTARNWMAQDLSKKFDEIKVLLHVSDGSSQRNMSNNGSQTDNSAITENDAERAGIILLPTPEEKFPCRLGTCEVVESHDRMISHIRYYHSRKFFKASGRGSDMYSQTWEMDYFENTNFDLALWVADMGLFFLRIKIYENGDLNGVVQIVNSNVIGKKFEYELKVGGDRRSSSFKQNVRSCRMNPLDLFEAKDCLIVEYEDMERMIASNYNMFSCTLILKRES